MIQDPLRPFTLAHQYRQLLVALHDEEYFTRNDFIIKGESILKDGDRDNPEKVFDRLLSHDVIMSIGEESGQFELAEWLGNTFDTLLQQNRRELSEVIVARVNALTELNKNLIEAIRSTNIVQVSLQLQNCEKQLKHIRGDIERSSSAVDEFVLLMNSSNSRTSVREKYIEIFDLWDHYIEPMGQMLQGTYMESLNSLDQTLEINEVKIITWFKLSREKDLVNRIRNRIRSLKDSTIDKHQNCRLKLKPLYEKARRNSPIAKGASKLIRLASKKQFPEGLVQIAGVRREFSLPSTLAIESFYSNWKNRPIKRALVSELKTETPPANFVTIDFLSLKQKIQDSLPIEDLTAYLLDTYPTSGAHNIVTLYFKVMDNSAWETEFNNKLNEYQIQSHTIKTPKVRVRENAGVS